ncbi:hypothetical protein N0V90_009974 [Kalmusia sp. IMI 367209]|nr:hypothetical protein N0V90_009974 [Kalmusia sp. IMI 367209]
MKGIAGYPGCLWLFVIRGGFTILSGLIMGLFLPDPFHNPYSLFLPGIHILQTRVVINDPNKTNQKQHIGLDTFKRAFSKLLIWIHISITMGNNGPFRGFGTYGPTIVKIFDFVSLTSNALDSVSLFLQNGDKRGET